MGSYRPRGDAQGLHIQVTDLPTEAAWEETVERLHRMTLLGLGDDVASVRVDLAACDAAPSVPGDITCRLTVTLRHPRGRVNVEARHPDGTLALMQAFTRAQRESQRHLDATRRGARRRYLGEGAD